MSREIIFTPLDGTPADDAVLAAAAALGEMMNAKIDAVFLGADDAAALMVAGDGFGGLGAAALEALRTQRRDAEQRARTSAEGAAASYRAHSGPRAHSSSPSRLCAFAVIDPAAARGGGLLSDVFQALLIEDATPVVVPRGPLPAKRIGVAWDGSREAARALKAAAPFVAAADDVIVFQAEASVEARDLGCADPALAIDWIARHGGRASADAVVREGTLGRSLLHAAVEEGVDLLVAGAFGHARIRQAVFGGVTRSLLEAEAPSLLLAH